MKKCQLNAVYELIFMFYATETTYFPVLITVLETSASTGGTHGYITRFYIG